MEPKYKLIYQSLKDDIINKKYSIGDKLPSEIQLAADYQVSRITSKRALTELENDGLVTRQAGVGTIVQKAELESAQKKEIIFVIPFANNNEFGDYTNGLLQVLGDKYQLTTITNEVFRKLPIDRIKSAEGVIYYIETLDNEIETITNLYLHNVPIVILDKFFEDLPIPAVTSDNFNGGYLATKELLKNKHQNISYLMVTPKLSEASVRSRFFGYLSALNEKQVVPSVLEINLEQDEDLTILVQQIKANNITALVIENDVVAIKIMNELRDFDIKIPQDLSIVGFDNIQASKLSYPALTTIDQNFVSLGQHSAKILLKIINDPSYIAPERTVIPVTLIKRQSIQKLGD
ncbi:GntR family transcriptional regulator [Companilactobacillus huachuanensis]|uniref:GntR family transcriptional regulator n=1 Tax=Companilactobacillus huachuanensis TaxID=2559914 RepID=A0ABW1RL90_9LACO|nr:GntR family transcriptional regulator [Companilactobacillus huachuanensis]